MKKLLTAAFAALAIASPAQAGQYMPSLYASEFCKAATLGVAWKEAHIYAREWAYMESMPNAPVGSDGYRIDYSLAIDAAWRLCPAASNVSWRKQEAIDARVKALNANPMRREFVSVWGAAPVEGVTPVWNVSQ